MVLIKLNNKKSKVVALSAVGIAVVITGIFATYAYGVGNSTTYIHASFIPKDVNQLARESDVVVIGTVREIGLSSVEQTDKYTRVFTKATIDIERELTGNYQEATIQVTLLGDGKRFIAEDEAALMSGERILLFLTHTTSDTVYGDAYAPIGGFQAKFSIDQKEVAHNEKHGDIPLGQLVSQIQSARTSP